MMKLRQVLLVTMTCFILNSWACVPEQSHSGCKIIGASCKCGYGCKVDYIYKTRRACRDALKAPVVVPTPPPPPERSSNVCASAPAPCRRGNCLQTTNDIGFTCKCEGTGFYGQRCEKACPTAPVPGMVFPHECIVI